MKNENILPGQLVPKEIRHEVYKEALKIVRKFDYNYKLTRPYLCLLLPCILWRLDDYAKNSPSGNVWNEDDMELMFLEMRGVTKAIQSARNKIKQRIRIGYLQNAINATQP